MTEAQIRYRLRKAGYLLKKRGDGYMILDCDRNIVIHGGEERGYSLLLDEVVDFIHTYVDIENAKESHECEYKI